VARDLFLGVAVMFHFKSLYGRNWRNVADSRLLTEEQFSEFIENFAPDANLDELRAYLPLCGKLIATADLAKIFPAIGFIEACQIRGAFLKENVKGCSLKYRYWTRWLQLGVYTTIKSNLLKKYPERPGWNDFYMVKWFVNRSPEDAIAIYWRARPGASPDQVQTSALWMIASVRKRCPEFDALMSACEEKHGALGESPIDRHSQTEYCTTPRQDQPERG
jgi:hypothetical protein